MSRTTCISLRDICSKESPIIDNRYVYYKFMMPLIFLVSEEHRNIFYRYFLNDDLKVQFGGKGLKIQEVEMKSRMAEE